MQQGEDVSSLCCKNLCQLKQVPWVFQTYWTWWRVCRSLLSCRYFNCFSFYLFLSSPFVSYLQEYGISWKYRKLSGITWIYHFLRNVLPNGLIKEYLCPNSDLFEQIGPNLVLYCISYSWGNIAFCGCLQTSLVKCIQIQVLKCWF